MNLTRIVSGGQTGVDRVALDWAITHQIAHGGWCPSGRLAEDGPIDDRYQLVEVPDGGGYRRRTKANVRDSDATLLITIDPILMGGSKETALFATRLGKPWLHVHPNMAWRSELMQWLAAVPISTLNVAGPRLSRSPEVVAFTWAVLDAVLEIMRGGDACASSKGSA